MGKNTQPKDQRSLKSMNGHKFKCMWSTKIMFFYFYIEFATITMAMSACLIDSKESIDFSGISGYIMMNVVFIAIMLLLVLINMKFSRVIAVINDSGIHSSEGLIHWKDIKAVKYHTRLPSRHITSRNFYCSISIYTNKREYEIVHAPRIMMWYIRKKKSSVKIELDYGLLTALLCPIVFGLIIGMIHKYR